MPRRNFFHKAQRNKWQNKDYKNPYFEHRETRDYKRIFKTLSISALVLIVVGFFLYSPLFQIKNISVTGLEFLLEEDVLDVVNSATKGNKALVIPKTHRFFIPIESIESDLWNSFRLRSVDVANRGGELEITIEENISRFLWQTGTQRFVVDENGMVLHEYIQLQIPEEGSEATQEDKTASLITIVDLLGEPIEIGDSVMSPDVISNILTFLSKVIETPITISQLNFDSKETRFMRADILDGYAVFFDPTNDLLIQFERLKRVLETESKDPSQYEYIDVRFGERVYVKDR